MRSRLALLLGVLAAFASSATARSAILPTATSTNWAGYAALRSGVHFSRVSAAWTVPKVDCSAAAQEWSAAWVGLGGYRSGSSALEQAGTDADCTRSGRAVYSAWYELVPDVSHTIRLAVHAGDAITTSVTVNGHRVRVRMADDTTGKVFARTLHASRIDLSSADWIVEAPAACTSASDSSCSIVPLANFGTMALRAAHTTTTTGRDGAISDNGWDTVRIDLRPGSPHDAGPGGPDGRGFDAAATDAGATASPLRTGATAFDVAWSAGA